MCQGFKHIHITICFILVFKIQDINSVKKKIHFQWTDFTFISQRMQMLEYKNIKAKTEVKNKRFYFILDSKHFSS